MLKMQANPKIITSGRGGSKLLLNGNIYYKSKSGTGGKIYWECKRVRTKECSARAITIGNGENITIKKGNEESPHSHPPNREEAEAENVKHYLKRVAEEHPELQPAQILRNELQRVSSGVLNLLPERENLKKSIRRERQRNQPANPTSLQELFQIPDRYTRTLDGERFLLFDSYMEEEIHENRVIVFGTKDNLRMLMNSHEWFLDGTFKVSPSIFMQMFTILGVLRRPGVVPEADGTEISVPLIYALLANKKQNSYTNILRSIVDSARNLRIDITQPTRIMCDFEMAIINSVRAVLPTSTISTCFFHLGQSLYRRVQAEGLQELYNDPEDRRLKTELHMLLALSFVPVNDVVECFAELREAASDDILTIFDFFNLTYISGQRAVGRRRALPPRYPRTLWNQYESTLHNEHRTNNLIEGFHNRFQQVVGRHHPSFYSAIGELQKEQGDSETMVREFRMGRTVKAMRKKKWAAVDKRIKTIVSSYETYKEENRRLNYLRHLAHNFTV